METEELHRGRLINHIQLVVRDLAAAQRFYGAIFEVLKIPMGGTGDDYFWADATLGSVRTHHILVCQAKDSSPPMRAVGPRCGRC